MTTERIRGRELQRILRRIHRRDGGLCQECARRGFAIPGAQVDHRQALTNGGAETDENRELLCEECHAKKTAEDLGHKPKGADADGWPTDPRHPWNQGKT